MFLRSSTLASLRFFEAAARLLSFKRAGIELHVTQGAVSQQIKHLEQALGCKLFVRLAREIRLTAEGQRFYTVVRRALESIETEAQALAPPSSTYNIRLRAGPSFALLWLVPRLANFYARHPTIKLSVNAKYGEFDPARRDFDLAIELVKGKLPTLISVPFMDEYLIPVCTQEYLTAHPQLKELSGLNDCTLLHDADPWVDAAQDAEWRHWLKGAGANKVDSSRGQFFSLATIAIEAALNGQGIAMGRTALVQDALRSRRLVAPFKRRVESPVKYWLAYPQALQKTPQIQAVLNWLRDEVVAAGAQ